MKHGILLFSLLVLLTGTAGGVLVLVQQGGGEQEIEPERPKSASSSTALNPPVSPTPPVPPPTVEPEQPKGKININTEGYEELQEITGVGPVIAQRIIDYRNQNGSFQTIEEIKNVSGIGDATFEKMKDEIVI